MDTEALVYQAGLNSYVLTRNLEGITHEDSVKSPEPAGNCINWVVGHMVKARNMAMNVIGQQPMWSPDRFDMYGGSGQHPFDPARAIPLDELIAQFQAIQGPLTDGMKAMSADALSAKAPFSPTGNPDETIGSLLAALIFHESHHSGQLGVLRRVIGKPGAIKSPN